MSDQMEPVSLELLGKLLLDVQREQRELRAEQRDQRSLLLALVEQGLRTDRHITDLRDDLELMLKSEVMGRAGHLQTQVEHRLDTMNERIEALERRAPQT